MHSGECSALDNNPSLLGKASAFGDIKVMQIQVALQPLRCHLSDRDRYLGTGANVTQYFGFRGRRRRQN